MALEPFKAIQDCRPGGLLVDERVINHVFVESVLLLLEMPDEVLRVGIGIPEVKIRDVLEMGHPDGEHIERWLVVLVRRVPADADRCRVA